MATLDKTTPNISTELGTQDRPLVVKPERPFEKPIDLINWEAPVHVFRKRPATWFLGLSILSLLIFLILALTQQWMLLSVVLAFVFVIFARNLIEPNHQTYAVTTASVKMNKQIFKYEDLKWFWFEQDEDKTILYVVTYLDFPHLLEIELRGENTANLQQEIEKHLLKYLPYHEETHRDMFKWLDRILYKISPWLPHSLINWYNTRFKL